ncbi:hypothetical protein EVAR_60054_1 [Eumeta japonica]|uniref:Uncharacterized protein n=1 Tax=Eumeta variegata TaxID=151549 RepID=A0A4C1ZL54_EUMVA|nr:hypothetical protein EVAR_60054_1 [Eumeta japonica]
MYPPTIFLLRFVGLAPHGLFTARRRRSGRERVAFGLIVSLLSVTTKTSGITNAVGNTAPKPPERTRRPPEISERALFVCINRCARAFAR